MGPSSRPDAETGMSDRITKLQRWLDLVAFLAGRRLPVTVAELREHVPAYALPADATPKDKESARRKFERDKDELRAAGIPIETVEFTVNYGSEHLTGYRLARRDFHLPYLRIVREAAGAAGGAAPGEDRAGESPPSSRATFELTREEAAAALGGLREIAALPAYPLAARARSAFRKLAFDLEPDVAAASPVMFVQDKETARGAGVTAVLSGAVLARKRVEFRYRGMHRDTDAVRRVLPYGLLFQHGHWYLLGHDDDRDAVRMFRVGRISDARPNASAPGTPDFEVPADFRLADYGGRSAWELGEDDQGALTATVLFRFPRSLWAERNGHGTLVEEREDGAQLRDFEVHRRDPFLRWVLSLAGDARVTAPDELRDAWEALVAEVARRYEGESAR